MPATRSEIPTWSDALPWPDPLSLIALYHARKPDDWARVQIVSEARLRKCRSYLRQFPARDFWEHVFAELHVPWAFELHPWNRQLFWLLQKGRIDGVENVVKVAEGRYRRPSEPGTRRDRLYVQCIADTEDGVRCPTWIPLQDGPRLCVAHRTGR
jgi:hypothetical protein